ncbi:adenylate/guanylate cyclase domain-containing protein [Nisaea sp.]|uniref:adenylate/guanylate cyclase domain-containing protein n=1 Tax=Nisaea sp. TaxID=2024842 RepID=UPI003B526D4E
MDKRALPREDRITIRTVLLRDIGGLFLVALAALLAVTLYFGSQSALVVLRDNAHNLMRGTARLLETHVEPPIIAAELIGKRVLEDVAPLDPISVEMVHTTMQLHSQIHAMGFFWPDGNFEVIASSGAPVRGTYAPGSREAQAVEEARQVAEPFIAEPIFSEIANTTLMTLRSPLFDHRGEYLGFSASAISLQDLSDYTSRLDLANGSVFVLDQNNSVIAHPSLTDSRVSERMTRERPLIHGSELGDPVLAALLDPAGHNSTELEVGDGIQVLTAEVDDRRFLALTDKVPVTPTVDYTVGIYVDETSSSYDDMIRYLIYGGIAGLVLIALAMLRLWQLAERIRRPVSELATASNAVAEFQFNDVPAIGGNNVQEFDDAAVAFNRMVLGLAQFGIYVPRSLVREILEHSEASGISSVDREVTVLFSDIVGFTTLSQSAPAEEVVELLNEHFTLMNEAIETEGGNIDKYVGDSVMAFWGAPAERKDHAAACLRAVRRIAELLRADNERRKQAGERVLHIRLGVATGRAVVGNIGAPGRINYTMIGDTVNIANRLEQLGKQVAPGTDLCVLVSKETTDAAGNPPDLEGVGEFELRGRSGSLKVYRLNLDRT